MLHELDEPIAQREEVPRTVWDGKVRMSIAGLQDKLAIYMFANAINLKVVLFFLLLLPQFVVSGQGGVVFQRCVLGMVLPVQAALLFAILAWFEGAIGGRLTCTPRANTWLNRVAGAVFVALGVRMSRTSLGTDREELEAVRPPAHCCKKSQPPHEPQGAAWKTTWCSLADDPATWSVRWPAVG